MPSSALGNSISSTPGSTVAVMLWTSTSSTRFIRSVLSTTPPQIATHPPHSPVPAPRGVTAIRRSLQYFSTAQISSALSACSTASGM